MDIGDQFLKFEIRALLGQGGHGWVYHGYDTFLDRHVAIKIIPSPADRGRDLGRRAQLEARMLCKLQHHNVVHVIDAGATAGGAVYIVMELLYGRTLREAIREYRRLSVAEVLSLGAQIADGVQAAHEQHTVHRDLKPENVFIREGNAIKVLDFGIAKFLDVGAATTQRDLLHGTILYMSPEHLQGLRVTVRSDIYALGTTLYEAFTGCPPCLLGMEEPTLESVTFAQINRMPQPLDVLTGTVPRFVARTIHRMLAKAPVDRFATMAEVAQVLRANLQRLAKEEPSAVQTTRRLWRGFHSIPPASGAVRMTDATTDVHPLEPTPTPLADAVALQARITATPLQFPLMPAIRTGINAPLPAAASTPNASQAALEQSAEEPALVVVRSPITLPQLLLCAVLLGTFLGVVVALIQTYPRSVAPQTNGVVSGSPNTSPPRVPVATQVKAPLEQATAAQVASAAPVASTAQNMAAKPTPPRPHPTIRATKPIGTGPSSGLSEPPAVEPATKMSVAPAAKPTASATRRPRAIYGSSDEAE